MQLPNLLYPTVVSLKKNQDSRGSFSKLYKSLEFVEILNGREIVEINYCETSTVGTIRGMHFQVAPFEEMKIVAVLSGKIFDVAIDMRKTSPTFGKCHSRSLSSIISEAFVIPEGFAHGYQTLTENTQVIYLNTAPYEPKFEKRIYPLDLSLKIQWPYDHSILSELDKNAPSFESYL